VYIYIFLSKTKDSVEIQLKRDEKSGNEIRLGKHYQQDAIVWFDEAISDKMKLKLAANRLQLEVLIVSLQEERDKRKVLGLLK